MSKKLPKILSKEEFEKLLEEAKKERAKFYKPRAERYTPQGIRINEYLLAMCLGFGAGMRISEITGYKDKVPALTFQQIENNFIRILSGKGGKDRVTLLPVKYFQKVDFKRADLEKMLPLKANRRSIQRYVTDLGKKVLNKAISFHTLRHGFGSTLAGAGRPLHEIQMLMGHSRLDTTGIYLHANPQEAIKGAGEVF